MKFKAYNLWLHGVIRLSLLYSLQIYQANASSIHNNIDPAADILSQDYELIADIYLASHLLTSNVFLYNPPEATMLPLQPLVDALEFPITIDPVARSAHGWFKSESNKFNLNYQKKTVYIKDTQKKLADDSLVLSDGFDIYVEISLLREWFSLGIQLDTSRLRIEISSEDALAIEKRMEREENREKNTSSKVVDYPIYKDEYRLLGSPIFDVNLGYAYQNGQYNTSYTLQGSGDLFWMESHFLLASVEGQDKSRQNFSLNKKPDTPDGELFFGIREISLGDVFAVSDDMIFRGGQGIGFNVEFGDTNLSNDFGKKSIEGDGPPTWEVELYRNGVLSGFQTIGDDGRYHFEDVSLEYGENVFDIRLFGPQGQERNRREVMNVGDNLLPVGQSSGRINYVNLSRGVFGANADSKNEQKLYLQWQQGVTDWLSVGVNYAYHKKQSTNIRDNLTIEFIDDFDKSISELNHYGKLSLFGYYDAYSFGLNTVFEKDGGRADSIWGQTSLNGISISAVHKQYNNFSSDRNVLGMLSSESELRIGGNKTLFSLPPFSYQFTDQYKAFSQGGYQNTFNHKLGFNTYGGRITMETNSNKSNDTDYQWTGSSSYSRVVGSTIRLRTALKYDIAPDFNLLSTAISTTWVPRQKLRLQIGGNIDHSGESDKSGNTVNLSATYLFDRFAVSLSSEIHENDGNSILFNIESSLGMEHLSQWSLKGYNRTQSGRAKMRVFLDKDNDGFYSTDDMPLPNVKFKGRSDWHALKTDDNGVVYLDDLSANSPTRLKLNEGSLGDPFWRADTNEIRIVSHAGGEHEIDIAVKMTVEVEGTVSLLRNGKEKPMAGLRLTVYSADGDQVAEILTEFDGYFIISGLADGEYTLVLDKDALERFKVTPLEPIPFKADTEEGLVYIDPIILE